MGWLSRSLSTSVGKKMVMAVTGLLLIMFLVIHFIGNYTIWGGREVFTAYVSALESLGWFTHVIEVLLALVFLIHIYYGLSLAVSNDAKRPIGYKKYESNKLIKFSARYTWQTGLLILLFLVIHLITFWYEFKFGTPHRELYDIVVAWFHNPLYALIYVLFLITLGVHIHHGFESAFQTFGWNHPKYTPWIEKFGTFLAWFFGLGFSLIPIILYFTSIGGK